MLECDGKWDVDNEFIYLFMEMGVGNPIENKILWVIFFMYKYWNSI